MQFHSGPNEFCSPRVLAKFAQEFPSVRFDFAHCCPTDEMAEVDHRDVSYDYPPEDDELKIAQWWQLAWVGVQPSGYDLDSVGSDPSV